jgi:hypothetical protein
MQKYRIAKQYIDKSRMMWHGITVTEGVSVFSKFYLTLYLSHSPSVKTYGFDSSLSEGAFFTNVLLYLYYTTNHQGEKLLGGSLYN